KDLKRFELLHEIGHAQVTGFLLSFYEDQMHVYYLCIPIFALLVNWTVENAFLCGTLLSVIVIVARIFHRWIRNINRLWDEVYADIFALERCPPKWLGEYPASELASEFCDDRKLSAEYNNLRRQLFELNVNRVRSGQTPGYDDNITLPNLEV